MCAPVRVRAPRASVCSLQAIFSQRPRRLGLSMLVINSLLTHHGALCQSSLCLGLSGGWRRRDAGAHFDGPPRASRPLPKLSIEVMSALSEERLHCSRPPRRLKLLMRPRFWWPRTSTVRRLERHLKNCCLAVPNCNSPLFHYARRSTGF